MYLTLHLHTDCVPTWFSTSTSDEDRILRGPSTYPLCDIASHHPHPSTHIHDISAPHLLVLSILHDIATLGPTFPPDATSHSVITPDLINGNTVDVPQIDDTSLHPHPTLIRQPRETATILSSPDAAAAVAARDKPKQCPPLSKPLRRPQLLFLHPLKFPSRTTRTSWRRIRVHQRFRLQLLLNKFSRIYYIQQVHRRL